MDVCMYGYIYICKYLYMYECMCLRIYLCMYVCMHAFIYACSEYHVIIELYMYTCYIYICKFTVFINAGIYVCVCV